MPRICVSLALLLALTTQFTLHPFQCMVLPGYGFFGNTFPTPLFLLGRSESSNHWSVARSQQ